MTNRILVSTVALLVTRDAMTILPVTVPEHELEIQKAIFGEESIEVRENQKTSPVIIDPEAEGDRLVGKYGAPALELAYGVNYKGKIAKELKQFKVGDAPDEGDAGLGGFNGDGEGSTSGKKAELSTGGSAAVDLLAMTKAELLQYASANSLDIVTKDMTKAEILETLSVANRSA